MNAQTNKNGFTIIEVVLVLAIAALIFLMIFIALPALQRGQANTARKNDVNAISSALGSFRSNGSGTPAASYDDIASYVDSLAQLEKIDTGTFDSGAKNALTNSAANVDKYVIQKKARCGSGGAAVLGSSDRQYAIQFVLQTGASSYQSQCTNA